MSKQLNITISNNVFEQIEKLKPEGIGKSEFVEELIRIGLEKNKGDE